MIKKNRPLSKIENVAYPFIRSRQEMFPEYVLRYTKAFTRMHSYKIYDDNAFPPHVIRILKTLDPDRIISIDNCPMTADYMSFDNPGDELDDIVGFGDSSGISNSDSSQNLTYLKKRKNFKLNNISKDEWYNSIFPKFKYNINSLGLRETSNLEDLHANDYIPVFGCSHTWGLGIPEEWIWYNYLNEDLPIFNCGIASSGIHEVYNLLKKLYEYKQFRKVYVVVPHAERFCVVSNKHVVESSTRTGEHPFLCQLSDINVSTDTRIFYSDIAKDALINFCKLHNIELKMYYRQTISSINDIVNFNLYLPPYLASYGSLFEKLQTVNNVKLPVSELPNYIARDCIHYGKFWHKKIAEYLLTSCSY